MPLLRWLVGADLADAITGDLEEELRGRARTSRIGARLWYWRAATGLVAYFGARQLGVALRGFVREPVRLSRAPGAMVRYALRSLLRTRWYTATVIGVIALTMALASTVFAVVDGVLFKPLPYAEPDRLFAIQPGFQDPSARGTPYVSPRELEAWQSAIPDVRFTGFVSNSSALIEDPNEDNLGLLMIQAEFFEVLGVRPLVGGFQPADFDSPPGAPRILISYELWQRRFGGNTSIVGQEVQGDPRIGRLQIAGVMPRGFVVPGVEHAHVFMPGFGPLNSPTQRSLAVVARAPEGVSVAVVRDRLEAAMRRLAEGQPLAPEGRRFLGPFDRAAVVPLEQKMTDRTAPLFRALLAAIVTLLLIASLNVSGLAAARAVDRSRDIALRRSLGARPADIARDQLVEQAVLFGTGSALGVALSIPLLRLTLALLPADLYLLKTPAIDLRVLGLASVATGLSLVLSSAWPVRRALRTPLLSLTAAGGRTATTRTRTMGRVAVVAGQVAGATVLVVSGSLLVGSLMKVQANGVGFDTRRLAILETAVIPNGRAPFGQAQPGVADRIGRLLTDVRAVPGVVAAGAAQARVLQRSSIESVAVRSLGPQGAHAVGVPVTPGFFDAAGLRLREGRLPLDDELEVGAPLLVVSMQYAARAWPGGSGIGQQVAISTGLGKRTFPPHTVVGIVEDVRFGGWDLEPDTHAFVPYSTFNSDSAAVVFVRTVDQPERVVPRLLELASSEAPALRIIRAAPGTNVLADTIRPRRLQSWLFGSFAAASLAIVAVGVLGLVAMAAARRTREVGVRMALGATRPRIVRQFAGEQLAAVVGGLAAGSLLAVWTMPLLGSSLYQLSVYDVRVWTASVIVVALTTFAGTVIPSLRASRVDPASALRMD